MTLRHDRAVLLLPVRRGAVRHPAQVPRRGRRRGLGCAHHACRVIICNVDPRFSLSYTTSHYVASIVYLALPAGANFTLTSEAACAELWLHIQPYAETLSGRSWQMLLATA